MILNLQNTVNIAFFSYQTFTYLWFEKPLNGEYKIGLAKTS